MNTATIRASVGSLPDSQGGVRSGMRLLPLARRFAVAFALIYGATCLAVYGAQRYLVFEPERTLYGSPADYSFPVRDVGIVVPGEPERTLHCWWIPAANPRARVVLYLHGNSGNVSTAMDSIAPLRELGYSVFMIDYRGYGASGGGFPSEAGVYQDAQSAWDYLVHVRGMNPANLVIYGHSLGGAIAIELALRHPEAAGLVVESSFTSIYDMAMLEARYVLLPVNLLLNQRFDSIDKVGRLRLPVLYIHGTADEIVPFGMGKALYNATPLARGFVVVTAGRHEDNAAVGGAGLRAAIGRFVEGANKSAPAGKVMDTLATVRHWKERISLR
jgi:fermentation-respiration switch protein FrsA (DUF1100 family)